MSGDATLRESISRKNAQKAQGQDFFFVLLVPFCG